MYLKTPLCDTRGDFLLAAKIVICPCGTNWQPSITGMEELSRTSLSVTDSHLDRELAFTDKDHYLNVARASGVPVAEGTPVHKHADASDLAERYKAEVRQSAIERYASETQGKWATKSEGVGEDLQPEGEVRLDGTSVRPADSTLDPVNTPPQDQAELKLKNLDTGEEFIIGENDPDFEFDTFELDPNNLNRTFTDEYEGKWIVPNLQRKPQRKNQ